MSFSLYIHRQHTNVMSLGLNWGIIYIYIYTHTQESAMVIESNIMVYLPINYIIEFRKIFVEIFYGKKGKKKEKEKGKEPINCFNGFFFIFYKSGIKIFLK